MVEEVVVRNEERASWGNAGNGVVDSDKLLVDVDPLRVAGVAQEIRGGPTTELQGREIRGKRCQYQGKPFLSAYLIDFALIYH